MSSFWCRSESNLRCSKNNRNTQRGYQHCRFWRISACFSGFLPKDTAKHHRAHVLAVLQEALDEAKIKPEEIDVVCYTKGQSRLLLRQRKSRNCAISVLWPRGAKGSTFPCGVRLHVHSFCLFKSRTVSWEKFQTKIYRHYRAWRWFFFRSRHGSASGVGRCCGQNSCSVMEQADRWSESLHWSYPLKCTTLFLVHQAGKKKTPFYGGETGTWSAAWCQGCRQNFFFFVTKRLSIFHPSGTYSECEIFINKTQTLKWGGLSQVLQIRPCCTSVAETLRWEGTSDKEGNPNSILTAVHWDGSQSFSTSGFSLRSPVRLSVFLLKQHTLCCTSTFSLRVVGRLSGHCLLGAQIPDIWRNHRHRCWKLLGPFCSCTQGTLSCTLSFALWFASICRVLSALLCSRACIAVSAVKWSQSRIQHRAAGKEVHEFLLLIVKTAIDPCGQKKQIAVH